MKLSKIKLTSLLSSLVLIAFAVIAQPTFACTAAGNGKTDLCGLISYLVGIMNAIVPLLFAIALVVFIWGIIKYIFAAEPGKLNDARTFIVFGIIGIAVMLSVWALAFLVKDSFFPNSPNIVTPNTGSGGNTQCTGCEPVPGSPYNDGSGIS